jgi:hypothetical protein
MRTFSTWQKILLWLSISFLIIALILFLMARKPVPDQITYGLSFNTPYAFELGLDPREVFVALLEEMGVRHFRLAAHWDLVEHSQDAFDYSELDFQLAEAEKNGAEVIFGVGRRLPRWPECHVPTWAQDMSWELQKKEIREYIIETVTRYKDSPAITHWQVENEPYLTVFAYEHCGDFDEEFLREEIELVRSLDNTRPILVTDSGNLGTWFGPYKNGDAFGTSVYVYFWNPELGQFKTALPPYVYRIKESLMQLLYGVKETFLIELSAEPWLLEPVSDVPIEVQYERMDVQKFEEILEYAQDTRFDKQYLWGGEWWYWLREQGEVEMWNRALEVYR